MHVFGSIAVWRGLWSTLNKQKQQLLLAWPYMQERTILVLPALIPQDRYPEKLGVMKEFFALVRHWKKNFKYLSNHW